MRAVQFPFPSLGLLVLTAWRPLVKRSYIIVPWVMHPVIAKPEQKPLALATGGSHPGVSRTLHHLCISSVPTEKTIHPHWYNSELSPLPIQIGLYFLAESSTKCGRIGCWGQYACATESRGQMPLPEVHVPPAAGANVFVMNPVSIPTSLWPQAIFKLFSRGTAL